MHPQRRVHLLSWFVAASVLLFVAATAAATFAQGPSHSATRPLSELVFGPGGVLLTAAFFVVGLGLVALAWTLHGTLAVGKGKRRATRLLTAAGLQVFCLGMFPTDRGLVPSTPTGWTHFTLAAVAFVLLSLSFVLYARLFAADPRWASVRRSATAVAWTGVAAFALHLLPVVGPIETVPYQGLFERILIAVLLLWVVLSSNHARALTRPARPGVTPPAHPGTAAVARS